LHKKHNILIVVVDCLGAIQLENLESKDSLPNFRKLREAGISMSDMVTVSTHTSPVFASLLTGLYPPSHGLKALRGFKLNSNLLTIQELFNTIDYQTLAWVTGPLLPFLGLDRGWDVYEYRDRTDYLGSEVMHSNLKWLKEHRHRGPWLGLLHIWELHEPRQILTKYDNSKFGNNAYYRALHTIDDLLGDILESVDLETTYLIVLGDHGENVNWKDYYSPVDKLRHIIEVIQRKRGLPAIRNGHGFHLYEDMIRIPLLLAGPGLRSGKTIRRSGSIVDVLPTCTHLIGLDPDDLPNWDGVNLLRDVPEESDRPLLVMTSENGIKWPSIKCVRQFPWKYWEVEGNEKMNALFNLQTDPQEQNNLIEQQDLHVIEMQKILEEILRLAKATDTIDDGFTDQEVVKLEQRLRDLGYL